MRRGLLLALGIAAVSAGCSGGDDDEPAVTSSGTEPVVTSSDAAELHVLQVWDESVGLYVEGARSFVRVDTAAGGEVIEMELQATPSGDEATILPTPASTDC